MFRFDSKEDPAEWKERGTGNVKILKHSKSGMCRLLMRRDKTHKICANHFGKSKQTSGSCSFSVYLIYMTCIFYSLYVVLPHMELKPNCGSDRAFVWSTFADFADEEAKIELLAIRFANADRK